MQIITNTQELQAQCQQWRTQGQRIVLVPTMGYYHAGHLDLMRYGRTLADKLVVSLFVNPAQFGPGEDLESYPRDLERDAALAERMGVDILYTPTPETMYAPDHATWVSVPDLAQTLCGVSRPIHFRGVCTVVLKLFMLTCPTVAVFGQKDWQQLAIIRRMVRDLNIPVSIEGRVTVREKDGLALSSRNVYLTTEERVQAPEIYRGLLLAQKMVRQGETRVPLLTRTVLGYWAERLPLGRLEYLSVVQPESLTPLDTVEQAALMACAIRVGRTRLIDNILLAE